MGVLSYLFKSSGTQDEGAGRRPDKKAAVPSPPKAEDGSGRSCLSSLHQLYQHCLLGMQAVFGFFERSIRWIHSLFRFIF